MIELENRLFLLKCGVLAIGALTVLASTLLPPLYALYVSCFLFGLQGVQVRALYETSRALRPTPKSKWPETNRVLGDE